MSDQNGETAGFIAGLIAGFIIAVPLAAWLSPRSGTETRQEIRQRGRIIRHQAEAVVRKPVEQIQQQIEQVRGDSVEDALVEGKAIAAARQTETPAP
jgi:gas vesicle protein